MTPKFLPFFMIMWIIGEFFLLFFAYIISKLHHSKRFYSNYANRGLASGVPLRLRYSVLQYIPCGEGYPIWNKEHSCVIYFPQYIFHLIIYGYLIVGLNFGILIVWVAISCVTLPLFQWIVRRRDVIAERAQVPQESGVARDPEKMESEGLE